MFFSGWAERCPEGASSVHTYSLRSRWRGEVLRLWRGYVYLLLKPSPTWLIMPQYPQLRPLRTVPIRYRENHKSSPSKTRWYLHSNSGQLETSWRPKCICACHSKWHAKEGKNRILKIDSKFVFSLLSTYSDLIRFYPTNYQMIWNESPRIRILT